MKAKLKRQRRPEVFLYQMKRRWHVLRSRMIIQCAGHRRSGRPRLTRVDDL
jgi:hypothetical protein